MPDSREDSVYLAELAKQAECYEEMVENMKWVCCLTRTLLVLAVLRGELFRQLSRRKNKKSYVFYDKTMGDYLAELPLAISESL
jgi:hypothetical protein